MCEFYCSHITLFHVNKPKTVIASEDDLMATSGQGECRKFEPGWLAGDWGDEI